MATVRPFDGRAPRLHDSVFLAESALVVGDVEMGELSSVWFGSVLRGDVNSIRIGARTNVQDLSIVHVTGGIHPTTVGDDVTLGHRVTLHGCTIEDRCPSGSGASVLDGAVVGEECSGGAGALGAPGTVRPPRSLALGAPAKPRRALTADEIASLRASAQRYVRRAQEYVREGWTRR